MQLDSDNDDDSDEYVVAAPAASPARPRKKRKTKNAADDEPSASSSSHVVHPQTPRRQASSPVKPKPARLTSSRPESPPLEPGHWYPFQDWDTFQHDVAKDGKPLADLRDLARSWLLTRCGPNQAAPTDQIACDIAAQYDSLTYGKGERWEKSLKEALRLYYCFTGHTKKGSRMISYACDPTVDPRLKKVHGEKRKVGSLSATPQPQTPASKEKPVPGSSRASALKPKNSLPKKRRFQEQADSVQEAANAKPRPLRRETVRRSKDVFSSDPVQHDLPSPDADDTLGQLATAGIQPAELSHDTGSYEFEVSSLFELQRNNEAFYALKCGPYLIRRRRRDSQFLLAPMLKLVRLSFGMEVKSAAAQKLFDEEEEHTVADVLLAKRAAHYTTLSSVKAIAAECDLTRFLGPILDDGLPELPDDSPLTRAVPPGVLSKDTVCHYCNTVFTTRRLLRRHHTTLAGSCQLENRKESYVYGTFLSDALGGIRRREGRDVYAEGKQQPMTVPADDDHDDPAIAGSSVPPSLTYWSEAEKDRFFFAVQRFSRFRADLIAEHVRTKNTSEVQAYLSFLEDSLCLMEKSEVVPTAAIPAAREMSERWVEAEEKYAEDAVVWEAFMAEASATPWQYRDQVQLAATRDEAEAHCTGCVQGACDGAWPTCGRCRKHGRDCTWINGFHPQALPDNMASVKAALRDLDKRDINISAEEHTSVIRAKVSSSLSWQQVMALGYEQRDAEGAPQSLAALWSFDDTSTARQNHVTKVKLRWRLHGAFQQAGLGHIDAARKEAIYARIKSEQDVRGQKASNTAVLPSADELQALNAEEDRKPAPIPRRSRKIFVNKALGWADIPLENASDTMWSGKEELEGVQDELYQAARQLKVTGTTADTLGEGGDMFALKRLAHLLDLHRHGSEDEGCMSSQAIKLLYSLLVEYITEVIATVSLSLHAVYPESKPKSKTVAKHMEAAIEEVAARRASSKAEDTDAACGRDASGAHRSSVFAVQPLDWYDSRTFAPFAELDVDYAKMAADLGVDENADRGNDTEEEVTEGEDEDEASAEDERIDEDDQLADHAYEEKLWSLFGGDAHTGAGGLHDDENMDLDDNEEQGSQNENGQISGFAAGFDTTDDDLEAGRDDDDDNGSSSSDSGDGEGSEAGLKSGPSRQGGAGSATPGLRGAKSKAFITSSDEEGL